MTDQEFNELYEEVKGLSEVGEVPEFNSETTSLYDWMKEGDCEGVPSEKIAKEWDALNQEE